MRKSLPWIYMHCHRVMLIPKFMQIQRVKSRPCTIHAKNNVTYFVVNAGIRASAAQHMETWIHPTWKHGRSPSPSTTERDAYDVSCLVFECKTKQNRQERCVMPQCHTLVWIGRWMYKSTTNGEIRYLWIPKKPIINIQTAEAGERGDPMAGKDS